MTIHPASRGAGSALITNSSEPHSSVPHTSVPHTAVPSDEAGPEGPVLYGYTAGVAERFAAQPVPGGDRPGLVIRVDRNLVLVSEGG